MTRAQHPRLATRRQKEYAATLGIAVDEQSLRVLGAQIEDALETRAFAIVGNQRLRPGMSVEYIGRRDDLPGPLVISTVGKNGYLYFKGTPKYCRPWNVRVLNAATGAGKAGR